jgi:ABC-type Fe3+/spermidine/putrescine transport system ATPase subunit
MKSLVVKGLEVHFPEYRISSDSFEVKPGEFFSIDAPSGFGKTTLLRAIMGFQAVSRGELLLGDENLTKRPPHLRNFGVVFQDHLLFSHLNAWENAVFGLTLRKRLDDGAILRAKAGFRALGLTSRMFANVAELSGGERQRVALLRAMLFRPSCLILDEPLKGLDAVSTAEVMSYLKDEVGAHPVPVLWVSHQASDLLPGGRIIGTERPGIRHFALAAHR